MSTFSLYANKQPVAFYVDKCAEAGVKKVVGKVCRDYNAVFGTDVTVTEIESAASIKAPAVVIGNAANSPIIGELSKSGRADVSKFEGCYEVFSYTFTEGLLVIAGCDKLGAIYGAFELSNRMGVSPMVYWGDSVVPNLNELFLECENFTSRVPSVRYRGLFINDEWPCFGNWCMDHFDGVNAKMYDNVFELLLRLKGNYLWPAMWASNFAIDGPGLASWELADEYGIYVGNSHHEPCLRAGAEYGMMRGKDSPYGDAWSFISNPEGIERFWKDGLERGAHLSNVCTVGMRGENDSTILGEDATLKDNIDLLKSVITCQKRLIHETEERIGHKLPLMLALYKEVEPYYYGDANTEGLKHWKELDDVILMLCEDNFGYMRTLPDDEMRNHPAGFGMYYHVDYHGDPISYEWVNSTPLTKIWEQMSQAYDYNVRQLWILNVGDLKHNEFPLSYFLNLAYDFDKWGTKAPNTTADYTHQALTLHFGNTLSDDYISDIQKICEDYIRLNGMRRPEALNPSIYHPLHFNEAKIMNAKASELENRTKEMLTKLSGNTKAYNAFYSLIGFQALASTNLIKMHTYAGLNNAYAYQGRKSANIYSDYVAECIERDKLLAEQWSEFANGKWTGMEKAAHVGFTCWNEDGCRFPIRMNVEPCNHPRMEIVRTDSERVYRKVYGRPMEIVINDFEFEGIEKVSLTMLNTGIGKYDYTIKCLDEKTPDWVSWSQTFGSVEDEQEIFVNVERSALAPEKSMAHFRITDNDTIVDVTISAKCIASDVMASVPSKTVFEGPFGAVVNAVDYTDAYIPEGLELTVLADYGIYKDAIKFYPTIDRISKDEPYVSYSIFTNHAGEFNAEFVFAPTSPLSQANVLRFGYSVNNSDVKYENTVPDGYRSGNGRDFTWAEGAMTHRRVIGQKISLQSGVNTIRLCLPDPGLVPLRIRVTDVNVKVPDSYFGPGTDTCFHVK